MFKVSAAWMKACGKGDEAKSFTIARVQEFPWAGEGFRKLYVVEGKSGEFWTVAECRGEVCDVMETGSDRRQQR